MRLVAGFDGQVAQWVRDNSGAVFHPPFVALGVVREDRLVGGFVFSQWTGASIEMSAHAPGCMRPGIVREIARYCFETNKVLRVRAKTRRSNVRVRKLLPRMGFEFEATLKEYYGADRANDALLFALDREAAGRWLKG